MGLTARHHILNSRCEFGAELFQEYLCRALVDMFISIFKSWPDPPYDTMRMKLDNKVLPINWIEKDTILTYHQPKYLTKRIFSQIIRIPNTCWVYNPSVNIRLWFDVKKISPSSFIFRLFFLRFSSYVLQIFSALTDWSIIVLQLTQN